MPKNGLRLRPGYARTTWGVNFQFAALIAYLTTSIGISDARCGHKIGPRYSSKASSWDRLCLESNTVTPGKPRHQIGFACSPIQTQHIIQNESCFFVVEPGMFVRRCFYLLCGLGLKVICCYHEGKSWHAAVRIALFTHFILLEEVFDWALDAVSLGKKIK